MYNRKSKTTMSITFNMYTHKALEHHESESKLHIFISELLYMGSSTQFSTSSLSMLYAQLIMLLMLQMIQDEGVYSRFSLLPLNCLI
jgi:hypothetical protein